MYATPTFITEAFHLVTQVDLLLTAYTVLTYSYWVSFHNAYQCQGYVHYRH